jgi:hypothetical protein
MNHLDKLFRRVKRPFGIAVLLVVVASGTGWAKETDSFTHRYEALAFPTGEVGGRPVSDFTTELNDQLQRVFAEVLAELNEENARTGESCLSDRARWRLFRKMSNGLGGPVVIARNRLRPAITHHPNRYRPEMSDSIYRDFSPWRSISLGLAAKFGHKMAALFRFDLERVVVESGGTVARAADGGLTIIGAEGRQTAAVCRLRAAKPNVLDWDGRTYYLLDNGQALAESAGRISRVIPILVSSDKFSHFFNRSLGLFKRLGGGGPADFDRVLAFNDRLEASLWGSRSTGVAAYGDLVANFQGMRFWIHLRGQGLDGSPLADPLGEKPAPPIVECSSTGRWFQTRAPDIRDYLDPAWDEALNCSRMRSRVLLDQVLQRIEGLGREDRLGRAYDCPIDSGLIAETAAGYGRFAPRVINARGHSSLREGRRENASLPTAHQATR